MRKYRSIFRFTQQIGKSRQIHRGVLNILVPYNSTAVAPTKPKIDLSGVRVCGRDLMIFDQLDEDDGR